MNGTSTLQNNANSSRVVVDDSVVVQAMMHHGTRDTPLFTLTDRDYVALLAQFSLSTRLQTLFDRSATANGAVFDPWIFLTVAVDTLTKACPVFSAGVYDETVRALESRYLDMIHDAATRVSESLEAYVVLPGGTGRVTTSRRVYDAVVLEYIVPALLSRYTGDEDMSGPVECVSSDMRRRVLETVHRESGSCGWIGIQVLSHIDTRYL